MIKLAVITHNEEHLLRLADRLHEEKDINLFSSIIIKNLKSEVKPAIEFLKQIIMQRPDILLLDQIILRDAAAMALQQILDYGDVLKATKIVIIGERFNEENVMAMIQGGVQGFFLTALDDEQLIKCIRMVAQGEIWLDRALATRVFHQFVKELRNNKNRLKSLTHMSLAKLKVLSRREMDVLALISESMTNEEIAEKLFLSTKTVKTHTRNIFEKTGIRNRVEAALMYTRYILRLQTAEHTYESSDTGHL